MDLLCEYCSAWLSADVEAEQEPALVLCANCHRIVVAQPTPSLLGPSILDEAATEPTMRLPGSPPESPAVTIPAPPQAPAPASEDEVPTRPRRAPRTSSPSIEAASPRASSSGPPARFSRPAAPGSKRKASRGPSADRERGILRHDDVLRLVDASAISQLLDDELLASRLSDIITEDEVEDAPPSAPPFLPVVMPDWRLRESPKMGAASEEPIDDGGLLEALPEIPELVPAPEYRDHPAPAPLVAAAAPTPPTPTRPPARPEAPSVAPLPLADSRPLDHVMRAAKPYSSPTPTRASTLSEMDEVDEVDLPSPVKPRPGAFSFPKPTGVTVHDVPTPPISEPTLSTRSPASRRSLPVLEALQESLSPFIVGGGGARRSSPKFGTIPPPARAPRGRSFTLAAAALFTAVVALDWVLPHPQQGAANVAAASSPLDTTGTAADLPGTVPVAEPPAAPTPPEAPVAMPGPTPAEAIEIESTLPSPTAMVAVSRTPMAAARPSVAAPRSADSEVLAREGDDAFHRGELLRALAVYQQVLVKNPGFFPTRLSVADVHWAQGDRALARQEYARLAAEFPFVLMPPRVQARGVDAVAQR